MREENFIKQYLIITKSLCLTFLIHDFIFFLPKMYIYRWWFWDVPKATERTVLINDARTEIWTKIHLKLRIRLPPFDNATFLKACQLRATVCIHVASLCLFPMSLRRKDYWSRVLSIQVNSLHTYFDLYPLFHHDIYHHRQVICLCTCVLSS